MKKQTFKLSINSKTACICLIAVIGYLVWDKYNTQEIIIANQKNIAAKKAQAMQGYANCISIAENEYRKNWDAACKKYAAQIHNNLNACRKLAAANAQYYASGYLSYTSLKEYGVAQCEHTYAAIASSKKDCTLPYSFYNPLNNSLKEAKEFCDNLIKTYL